MNQVKINGEGCLRVRICGQGATKNATMRRFVKTNGVIGGKVFANEVGVDMHTLKKIVDGISRVVRAGYEVRLGSEEAYVRFYPLLTADGERMVLRSQVCGNLCDSLNGLTFSLYHNGEEVDTDDLKRMNEEVRERYEKSNRLAVTPDMVVTCPECGTEFRVGKQLT